LARTTKAPARPLSNEEVGAFARACITIANDAADENGFVAIPKLLKRFHAELVIRPLLVEGMLATQPGVHSKWTVLVDSERYGVTQSDIEAEDIRNPLPSRLRFTVAHELAHSLAFRPSDFGIRLVSSVNTNDAKSEVVRAIEGITDRLTPLLLLSETALTQFFKSPKVRTSASDLAELRHRSGISRQALIGRLRGLSQIEADKVSRYSLNNIAICIGEWRDQHAVIRNWPVFARFQRNSMPEFLLNLRNQDRLPAPIAFAASSFAPCGGTCSELESVLHAGTMEIPRAEQIAVHCSSEQTARTRGTEFLIVIRKMPLTLPGVGVVPENP
jgi:hypothetical protein